jgi:hypothetical protein
MHSIPVDPAMDEKGRIRALVPFLQDKATPVPLGALDGRWDFTTSFSSQSADLFARVGVGTLFGTTGSFMHRAVVYDVLVGKDRLASGEVSDGQIVRTFWGAGLRVAVRYQVFDSKTSLSLGMLAAAVELKAASAQYQVSAFGLGPEELALVLEGVPALGALDLEAFGRLMQATDRMKESIPAALTAERLRPLILGFAKNLPISETLDEGTNFLWAMRAIASGMSLAAAKQNRWASVAEHELERIYLEHAPNGPDSSARASARAWLAIQ